jgi:hypothetical protein
MYAPAVRSHQANDVVPTIDDIVGIVPPKVVDVQRISRRPRGRAIDKAFNKA